jgi:lysophospholipase L1-like esterase
MTAYFLSLLLLWTNFLQSPKGIEEIPVVACSNVIENQWKGKRVAFLGDSITDKRRVGTNKCYWEYLAEMLGFTPFVYAVNGHRMDNIQGQAERLLEERGDDIDAIIIFAGTNDYNGGLPLGNWYEETNAEVLVSGPKKEMRKHRKLIMDEKTFTSSINRVMNFLKTNYPDKQVILLTPLHRAQAYFGDQNIQPEESYANKIGNYIDDYVDVLKQTSNIWAVPVIDLNSVSGLYPLNDAHIRYFNNGQTDRLHPNELGHYRIAITLKYQLLALPASI